MKKYLVLGFALLALSARLPAQSSVNAKLSAAASTCNTTNACLILPTPNLGGVTFTVSANASSNTLQFEASADFNVPGVTSPTWVSLNATPSNSSTAASSTTSTGTWQANISAYRAVRIRMSSLVSGTSTVTISTSPIAARTGGGGSSGTVTSVSGTTNQIDVATGTTTPVVSVDSTFLFPGTFGYSSLGTGTFNGIGATPTDANLLTNTTAAAAAAQQYSPSIHWTGQGWKTTATAASQTVDFRAYVIPVQGTTNPSGIWQLESQINGGGYANSLQYTSGGQVELQDGSTTNPSYSWVNQAGMGWYRRASGVVTFMASAGAQNEMFAGGIRQGSNGVWAWTNTSGNASLASDTGVSRGAAGLVDIGTGASANTAGFVKSAQSLAVTASDFTCSTGCTSLATITGLSATLPLVAANWSFNCHLIISQATAAATDQIGVQTATNASTNLAATAIAYTAAAVSTSGSLVGASSTSSQSVLTFTPGATGTNLPLILAGTVEGASASGTVLNIQILTGSSSDAITVKRGSTCWIY